MRQQVVHSGGATPASICTFEINILAAVAGISVPPWSDICYGMSSVGRLVDVGS